MEGQFFETSGLYLMCATHGAIYEPDTGKCVGGPCRGGRLASDQVDERDTPEGRAVFWLPDGDLRATEFRSASPRLSPLLKSLECPINLTPESKEPIHERPRRAPNPAGSARGARAHRARGRQRTTGRAPLENLSSVCVFLAPGWLSLVWGVFDFSGDKLAASARRHTALIGARRRNIRRNTATRTPTDISAALESAFEDDGTAGVILRCDSPGGSPVQGGHYLRDQMRRLQRETSVEFRSTWSSATCARRADTTSRRRPTRSMSTRRASSARSAC